MWRRINTNYAKILPKNRRGDASGFYEISIVQQPTTRKRYNERKLQTNISININAKISGTKYLATKFSNI